MGPAPAVTSVSPTHGPLAGGTTVTVNGSNFVSGSSVVFGSTVAATVTFVSATQLTAVTAMSPGAGLASVTVANPDGQSGSLTNAFTFDPGGPMIADAVILNPLMKTDTSGTNPLSVVITAKVEVSGVTDGTGQGMGVQAQVGFAPLGQQVMTWVDAAYTTDAGPYDTYAATVMVPGASGTTPTTYLLEARFSIDNGTTWVLADFDGSQNGFETSEVPQLTVSEPTVDWCKLGGEVTAPPDVFNLRVGQTGPVIYGQVYKLGVTDKSGAGVGITGQLGIGSPTADAGTWTWLDATYNHDTGSGANDEFMATLPTSAAFVGDERFAFRFALNGGPYQYCDSDGLDNGFTIAECGTLELKNVGIDQCNLQFPLTLTSVQGVTAGPIYGRVLATTVTEAAGPGPGIAAQVGYGPMTSTPSDTWTWTNAAYDADEAGGFEEWQASITGPAAGTYAYTVRFRYDAGPWSYCDSDPADTTVDLNKLGVLSAHSFGPLITACNLQSVSSFSIGSGDSGDGRGAGSHSRVR